MAGFELDASPWRLGGRLRSKSETGIFGSGGWSVESRQPLLNLDGSFNVARSVMSVLENPATYQQRADAVTQCHVW